MTDLERLARARAEHVIRDRRRWDTDPDRLEVMLPGSIDYSWREFVPEIIALLRELREPSIIMSVEAVKAKRAVPAFGLDATKFKASWQAAIDAILEGGE